MDLIRFRASLDQAAPPAGLPLALQAMWWDGKGDWDKAHGCAQALENRAQEGHWGDLVHAYLHRKEGDQGNAGYWYGTAGASFYKGSLDEEWAELAAARLKS